MVLLERSGPDYSFFMSRKASAALAVFLLGVYASAAPVEVPAELRIAPESSAMPLPASAVATLAASALAAAPSLAPSAAALPALAAPAAAFNAVPAAVPTAPSAVSAPAAAAVSAGAAQNGTSAARRAVSPVETAATERNLDAGDLFDGRAARPAADDLESLFKAAMPKSPAVAFFKSKGGFAAAAAELVGQYTFVKENLLESVKSAPEARGPQGRALVQSVQDLVAVADARQDPAARKFLEALGRAAAYKFFVEQRLVAKMTALGMVRPGAPEEGRHMPRNALGSGDYWDMAAGMNAAGFIMKELEPGTHYSFFDFSPFVTSYLNTVAEMSGADVSVVEEDILRLARPARPLSVLRTKNAVAYVPNFEKKLEEMADWIAPGGRLVLQNDPMPGQRELIIKKHGALARRLLQEGWDMSFEFASDPGAAHALDTLIFTRPKTPVRPRTSVSWQRYVDAVQKVNRDDMLRHFFR